MELCWNVYRFDCNSRQIVQFNVFHHIGFAEELKRVVEKYKDENEKIAEEVEKMIFYYFWSKFEYEVVVSELTSGDNPVSEKIDIYDQIKMNFDHFLSYILSHKKEIKKL